MVAVAETNLAIHTKLNVVIAAAIVGFHFLILYALPVWLLPISPLWGALVPLFIWVHNTHWALIHEAVHKLFCAANIWNERAGRALSILMGASFHVLRFGHMMHHQYNREWESEITSGHAKAWQQRLFYYGKLLGGLYVTEVAITLLAAFLPTGLVKHQLQTALYKTFPPAAAAAEQVFLRRGKLKQVRIDAVLICLLYGAAFYTYGQYWPWLLLMLGTRALAISFFDNIYHYATAADNSEVAQEWAMPRYISRILLHANYHETHHYQPNIPWHRLPAHQRRPFTHGILQGARQQLHGPIFFTPIAER